MSSGFCRNMVSAVKFHCEVITFDRLICHRMKFNFCFVLRRNSN